ncbi:hypothetical protein Bca4012_066006 [Brassica carinata]
MDTKGILCMVFAGQLRVGARVHQKVWLVYVDYKTGLTRHPKYSAYWFMKFLKGDEDDKVLSNSVPYSIVELSHPARRLTPIRHRSFLTPSTNHEETEKQEESTSLADNRLPQRHFATDRFPIRHLNIYSSPDLLPFLHNVLHDTPEFETIRQSCFGKLFDLPARQCRF